MLKILTSHIRWFGAFGLGAASGLDLILTHQDQLNQLIGAAIVIVTVVTGLLHDYELKRAELHKAALNPQPLPPSSSAS